MARERGPCPQQGTGTKQQTKLLTTKIQTQWKKQLKQVILTIEQYNAVVNAIKDAISSVEMDHDEVSLSLHKEKNWSLAFSGTEEVWEHRALRSIKRDDQVIDIYDEYDPTESLVEAAETPVETEKRYDVIDLYWAANNECGNVIDAEEFENEAKYNAPFVLIKGNTAGLPVKSIYVDWVMGGELQVIVHEAEDQPNYYMPFEELDQQKQDEIISWVFSNFHAQRQGWGEKELTELVEKHGGDISDDGTDWEIAPDVWLENRHGKLTGVFTDDNGGATHNLLHVELTMTDGEKVQWHFSSLKKRDQLAVLNFLFDLEETRSKRQEPASQPEPVAEQKPVSESSLDDLLGEAETLRQRLCQYLHDWRVGNAGHPVICWQIR